MIVEGRGNAGKRGLQMGGGSGPEGEGEKENENDYEKENDWRRAGRAGAEDGRLETGGRVDGPRTRKITIKRTIGGTGGGSSGGRGLRGGGIN